MFRLATHTAAALILTCMFLLVSCSDSEKFPAKIAVLSSRADTVSGGTSLISVTPPAGVSASSITVTVNDADVTAAFKAGPSGGLIGLIQGLKIGENSIKVSGRQIQPAELVVKNHPITGPIFAGPREQPFYCMTDKFKLPASDETLGLAKDADCTVDTRVDYVYRTTTGKFAPLPKSASRPGDLAQTTTSEGKTVPYVVRVETGTIDRGIYQTAVLSDPAKDTNVSAFTPPSAWNGRLVYTFGGGCVGGWYIQGSGDGNGSGVAGDKGVLEDLMLRQGYGVASSSLNVFGSNCGHVSAAEVMSMVKEHFIKTLGVPKFTIGVGCSGGSEQLHPIGDAYPGLIDGIIVGCNFPDVLTSKVTNVTDADLFEHYMKNTKTKWTVEQYAAATGYPNATSATLNAVQAIRVKAQNGACNNVIPKEMQYDRTSNPKGVRCDIFDHNANYFGRDPATGAARRTLDNVGVQYGLAALNDGRISKAQFIDLNQQIGGYDNDGNYVSTRTVGDLDAIRRAYETGQVTNGGLGLKTTPMINYEGYADLPENPSEGHSRFHTFATRARLVKVNGTAANQVMLVESGLPPQQKTIFNDASPVVSHALTQMDQWLTNLSAAAEGTPTIEQIIRAKPADLEDACFTDSGTKKIAEPQVFRGDTACNKLYPAYSSPRMEAGEPITNDVLKCQLQSLDPGMYKIKFTDAELKELNAIFPEGVCDYSKPGVNEVPTLKTWQFY